MKIGFGKRIKPRTFDYVPRFYDPAKEELKERLSKYIATDNPEDDLENLKNRIKSGLRMKHNGDESARTSSVRQSNLRLIYIIFILGFAAYLLMSSNKIMTLIESFSN